MTDTLVIRPWMQEDGPALRPMLLDCLRSNYDHGADFPPTERNVSFLLELGVKWSEQGEPTLVACPSAGQPPIAYTLWGNAAPLGLDLRDRVCAGLGTYVMPDFRLHGVSIALRAKACDLARALGYKRIQGVAYHKAGRSSARAAGFREVAVHVERVL